MTMVLSSLNAAKPCFLKIVLGLGEASFMPDCHAYRPATLFLKTGLKKIVGISGVGQLFVVISKGKQVDGRLQLFLFGYRSGDGLPLYCRLVLEGIFFAHKKKRPWKPWPHQFRQKSVSHPE